MRVLIEAPQGGRADVKFLLEVDMGDTAFDGQAVSELGRILRYWGGNLKYFEMKPGSGAEIRDSAYREVGRWSIVETSGS
jgi:hypothetical protein